MLQYSSRGWGCYAAIQRQRRRMARYGRNNLYTEGKHPDVARQGEPHMTVTMEKEHLTEDLLKRLLASSSVESYLDTHETVNTTLTEFLRELIDARRLKRSEVARESGLNPTVVYDIFAGKSRPGRDHAIMLALGIGCTLRETQRLLRLDSVAELWCKDRRDAIVIWCIEHGMSRACTDDELYRLGERTLLGTNSLR